MEVAVASFDELLVELETELQLQPGSEIVVTRAGELRQPVNVRHYPAQYRF